MDKNNYISVKARPTNTLPEQQLEEEIKLKDK